MSDPRDLSLYVHWPFCQSKCPYCDFNSHVSASVNPDLWQTAFLAELERYAKELPDRVVKTVFFGGGTPSLMPPSLVGAVLDKASDLWGFDETTEITLEANPGSVDVGNFRDFRAAGVNRVSVGIQALNDQDLKRLGRLHSVAEGQKALDVAQGTFDRVSFDLIYARQHQSIDDWRAELTQALARGTEHLSLYQLTVEPETVFGKRHALGQLKGLPSDDLAADMYELTDEMTRAAGLPAYEISNHAGAGAWARHNLVYWRSGDYIGIGPGAHGRMTLADQRFATETAWSPQAWLDAVAAGNGENLRSELSEEDQLHESLLMGLRVVEGVPLELHGGLESRLNTNKINELVDDGFLKRSNTHLSVTQKGRMVLNRLLAEILL